MSVILQKIKENISIFIVIILGLALIIGGIIYSMKQRPVNVSDFMKNRDPKDCEISVKKALVDGSGNDIYPAGTILEVEMNYYNCHAGARNEVAMIMSPGRSKPIFKYIKMVPGDKFDVKEVSNNKYRIEINGDEMENLEGKTYEFTERKSKMVSLYESNYKDGIREGAYFVFGSTLGGGFDSTRFGPVTSENMIGRVVRVLNSNEAEATKSPQDVKPEVKEPAVPANAAAPVAPAAQKPAAKETAKKASAAGKSAAKPAAKPAVKKPVQPKK